MDDNKFDDAINAALDANPNYQAANDQLSLSPEEQNLYRHHLMQLGNGGVPRDNGDLSTVYQAQVGIGGDEYNIPTIYNNKELSTDDAVKQAIMNGLGKMPHYKTSKEAEDRYNLMHQFMEQDTKQRRSLVNGRQ